MKLLVGSYNKDIYEVEFSKKDGKFLEKELFAGVDKPSYVIPYRDTYAYIYMKEGLQYVKVGNEDVLIGDDASCHLSYDKRNELIYSSHYHTGNLYLLSKKTGKWDVLEKYQFTENSHIHFAEFINSLGLLGVCDLGENKIHLYEVNNKKLALKTSFEFNSISGPRHFVVHKTKPIIYVILEHSGEIVSLYYEDGTLTELQNVSLAGRSAAAIRISNNGKFVYTSERDNNTISSFEILEDGFLIPLQTIETFGKHPRDFNLSPDGEFVIAGNMHSNTLSLYERDLSSGSLILLEKDYEINEPASILFIK